MTTSTTTAPARPVAVADTDRDTYQAQLMATYRGELAAAGGDPRLVSSAGRQALAELMDSLDMLLRHQTNAYLARKFPGLMTDDLFDECLGAARVACLEAATQFDPARGKFRVWAMRWSGGVVSNAVRATALEYLGRSWMSQGKEIAARYGHVVRSTLRAEGSEPTSQEVREETLRRCQAWALEKVDERREREGLPAVDEGDEGAQALRLEAAMAKLRQSGVLGAVTNELDEILAMSDAARSFDDPNWTGAPGVAMSVGDTTAQELLDRSAGGLERVAVLAMSGAERTAVWAHLSGEDGPVPTGAARKSRAKVEQLLERSRVQLASPHAHFAALSPTLGLQFEVGEAPQSGTHAAIVDSVRRAQLHM